jgi:hypothetical protein
MCLGFPGVVLLLGAAQAWQLAGVNQLLFAPGVDGLIADVQIGSDLGDGATRCHQIDNLAVELLGGNTSAPDTAPSRIS